MVNTFTTGAALKGMVTTFITGIERQRGREKRRGCQTFNYVAFIEKGGGGEVPPVVLMDATVNREQHTANNKASSQP